MMADLSADDFSAIEDIHEHWLELERRGDNLAVLQLCTDDVMWMPPTSSPLVGQLAITEWLRSAEHKIINLETTNIRIRGSGSVAYKTSGYSTSYQPTNSSDIKTAKGAHLWILHKLENAGWKVAVVTWSMFEATRIGAN
jgi:ketosteroid isomerase-like protein